jgi:hypothetical protein
VQYVEMACRCAVALVFATAAGGKLRGRAAFGAFTGSVRALVPELAGRAASVGVVVVVAEVAVVVLLVIGGTAPAGFGWAAVVLLAFSAATVRAVRAGSAASCGCFGVTPTPLGSRHLVRNAGILVIAAAGAAAGALAHGEPRVPGVVLALASGVVLALVVVFFDDLADLFLASAPGPR